MGTDKSKKVDIVIDIAALLWRRRRLIAVVTIVATALSFVATARMRDTYTALCTFLPAQKSSLPSSLLSQYTGIASSAGLGASSWSRYGSAVEIKAILNSRSFAEKMVGEFGLASKLIEHPEKLKDVQPERMAIKMFQTSVMTLVPDTRTSLITISVRTKKPELSCEIATEVIDLLQRELKGRTLSASGKNTAVLERQLADREREVRAIQDRLIAYQKKNKLIIPSFQSQAGLQFYQALIQQKISFEIEISRLKSTLSADNAKIVAARNQLAAVQEQIADYTSNGFGIVASMEGTPSLMMEYDRMISDLTFAAKMYGSLFGTLEVMKLQAALEIPSIEVIDRPNVPEKPSGPSRVRICAMGALRGIVLSLILAFVSDGVKKLRSDPKVRAMFVSPKRKGVS